MPRRRRKPSICVTSTASTNWASATQFICLLSKVDGVSTDSVSLRHSNAATIRHRAKAVNATDWPVPAPSEVLRPSWMSPSRTMVSARPPSPTVTSTGRVSTDSPRGRGLRSISPGLSRSKPSAKPKEALTTKWIHSTCGGVKGSPAAMLKTVAPRKVSTNVTSRSSTNRMYFVRLS